MLIIYLYCTDIRCSPAPVAAAAGQDRDHQRRHAPPGPGHQRRGPAHRTGQRLRRLPLRRHGAFRRVAETQRHAQHPRHQAHGQHRQEDGEVGGGLIVIIETSTGSQFLAVNIFLLSVKMFDQIR